MQDRKDQILELATALIQSRSYSSFSYQDLSERLGISKPAIHHHYPSKESLGLAVAERYHDQVRSVLDKYTSRYDDPWKQFEGYVSMVTEIIKTEERICAAGSVQSEYNNVPARMRDEMAALVRFVISWIATVIEAGRKRGTMDFPGDAADQAIFIFAAIQGALQIGRAQGKDKFDKVIRQIRKSLRSTRQ